jgi:hypothetical protein
MNKKEIKNKVNELLASGVAKSEVFAQLSGQGVKDNQLAYYIAAYAPPHLTEEYAGKVSTLVTLMFVQALIASFMGFIIGAKIGPTAQWVFAVLIASIPLLFAWGFYKNYVGAYNAYILLSVVQLPKQFTGISESPIATSIGIAVGLGILIFVWYLQRKIFPDFTFVAPKKIKGKYVFSDTPTGQLGGAKAVTSKLVSASEVSDDARSEEQKTSSVSNSSLMRKVVFTSLGLIALGGAIYLSMSISMQHELKDAIKRPFAPNFELPPNQMQSVKQDEWIGEYKRRGYEFNCYGNLRPEEKASQDDDYTCWSVIKSAYDNIPARMLVFWFHEGRLQHIKIEFPESSFAHVQEYLARHFEGAVRLDQSPNAKFGKNIYGKPLMVWATRSGIVVTDGAHTTGRSISMLWTSREKMERDMATLLQGANQDEKRISDINVVKDAPQNLNSVPPVQGEVINGVQPIPLATNKAVDVASHSSEVSSVKTRSSKAAQRRPSDLTYCLDLKSNYEIAKCAEQSRDAK